MKKSYLLVILILIILIAVSLWQFYRSSVPSQTAEIDQVTENHETADHTEWTELFSNQAKTIVFVQHDYNYYSLTVDGFARVGELNTERGFGDDIDATVYVLNWRQAPSEQSYYVRLTAEPNKLYALDQNRSLITEGALEKD